jgi:hypothetical protein
MPLLRNSTIDPLSTVAQLLSHLQLNGYLDNIAVPHWAEGGTSVEELIEALQVVGDGRWLVDTDDGRGVEEASDQWLLQFLQGKPVALPDDLKHQSRSSDQELGSDIDENDIDFAGILEVYLENLPEPHQQRTRARLLNEKEFATNVSKHINEVSFSLAICAIASDDEFQAHSHSCLLPQAVSDQDLRAIAIFFLQNEEALQAFAVYGPDAVSQAKRRSLAIVEKLARCK